MDLQTLRRIERTNYLIATTAVVCGLLLLDRPQAFGLGVGAVIASLNFSTIRRLVERWTSNAPKQRGGTAFLFVPKTAVLIAAVFVAIHYLPLSAPAFAIGFSTFLVSIAIESVRFASRTATSE